MKAKHILLLMLLPLLAQCTVGGASAGRGGSDSATAMPDKDQVWQLVAMQGRDLPRSTAEIILMFHPESGTLRGRVACNRYFADYSLNPSASRFKVTHISGGDVQCPEGGMAEQERYLSLLSRVDACRMTATTLSLYRQDKEILRFELQ